MLKKKWLNIVIILLILTTSFPARSVEGKSYPSADDAMLLMISAHVRLEESTNAFQTTSTLLSPIPQPKIQDSIANEVDILIDLYANYLDEANEQGHINNIPDSLVKELEQKLETLQEQSKQLQQARRRRTRRGFFGFVNRFAKGLGRAVGWTVDKAMQATGTIAKITVEEVGPKLLKDMVLYGQPINAQIVRAAIRNALLARGRKLVTDYTQDILLNIRQPENLADQTPDEEGSTASTTANIASEPNTTPTVFSTDISPTETSVPQPTEPVLEKLSFTCTLKQYTQDTNKILSGFSFENQHTVTIDFQQGTYTRFMRSEGNDAGETFFQQESGAGIYLPSGWLRGTYDSTYSDGSLGQGLAETGFLLDDFETLYFYAPNSLNDIPLETMQAVGVDAFSQDFLGGKYMWVSTCHVSE